MLKTESKMNNSTQVVGTALQNRIPMLSQGSHSSSGA